MGFRFRKSIKIAPGVRLNVGSKSMGISVGGKGLRYSVNSRRGSRITAGIPGTGVSYSTGTSSRQYKTSAYQRNNELRRLEREQSKLEAFELAKFEVELFENKLEMLRSIHKESDEIIDWRAISMTTPPFNIGEKGQFEIQAEQSLHSYKPNLFQKWFKYDQKIIKDLNNKLIEAREIDKENFRSWEFMVKIANKILSGDLDTYLQVIEEMSPLDDLSDFGSGFEIILRDTRALEVEFDVHAENVIPNVVKTLTKTGKVSTKDMSKTQFYELYQDYVCSCILRISRDMFAILPVDNVYIHAYDELLNTATGYKERVVVLSVNIDKQSLMKLNFEAIDCSDSMSNFQHHMSFQKTIGFKAVSKINN